MKGSPVAVILVDIDFLKVINDLHGHSVGDDALILVAGRLRQELRGTDVIIRFGGDEFLLLLPGETREGAQSVLEKVKESVKKLSLKNNQGKPVPLSVSGGIAMFPEDGEVFRTLLEKVDKELQVAKRSIFGVT